MMFSGERLRLEIEKKSNQQKIANAIGVARNTVNRWCTGRAVPDLNSIAALSDALGVSTDYLIKGAEHGGDIITQNSAPVISKNENITVGDINAGTVHNDEIISAVLPNGTRIVLHQDTPDTRELFIKILSGAI